MAERREGTEVGEWNGASASLPNRVLDSWGVSERHGFAAFAVPVAAVIDVIWCSVIRDLQKEPRMTTAMDAIYLTFAHDSIDG